MSNPAILRVNFEVKNFSNVVGLNLDINLLKEIDGRVMVYYVLKRLENPYISLSYPFQINFAIFKETPEKLNQIFSLPKNNYCTLLRNSNNIPFIKDFFKQVARFGNIPMNCPIKKGNYYLENFHIASVSALPAGFDSGKYQVHFKMVDENEKVPVLIIRFKSYI
jgi:hypothetical protein